MLRYHRVCQPGSSLNGKNGTVSGDTASLCSSQPSSMNLASFCMSASANVTLCSSEKSCFVKRSAEEKPCYCEELKCTLWTNNQERYNILLCIRFRFRFVHLQHSNVSNLNTVCALYYKFIVLYTPLQMSSEIERTVMTSYSTNSISSGIWWG